MPDTATTYSLPYVRDSSVFMRQLERLERPVFLDSGSQRGAGRRFDILSAAPLAWLQVSAGTVTSSDPDLAIPDIDIFSSIRQLRDKYPIEHEEKGSGPSLPFQGGLMGYLGYPQLAGRAGLVVQDAYVGVYPWALVIDHAARQAHLLVQPACPEPLAARLRSLLTTTAASAQDSSSGYQLDSAFRRELSRQQYDVAFAAIKRYIAAGDCYQVNLTQRVSATCSGAPFAAYLRLRAAMPAPFSAYIGWPGGALLSLSPERFLRLTGSAVLTQPIKGTRPRHPDPGQDAALARELRASEKDQAENLMIVDLLRNDLGRVCETGTIHADQLFSLQSFSNVHHLVSSVTGQLRPGHDALDLLQACFPGGSITGAPKLRAMAIIQELEAAPRRVYCGTAFYLDASGNMDSSITIRSLLWEAGQLFCWAGGGIVDDSQASAEYTECFDKINRIINCLSDKP